MPDFDLFQERTISGKGVIRVPSELKKRRAVVLYSDLLRPPKSPYYNSNYNPPQSLYGYLTFLREGYVIADTTIKYKQQSWSAVPDITAQNLIAVKCMYKGILQSFVNQNLGLGLTVTNVTDLIKDYEYLDLMWDEVKLVCYGSTALKLSLYALPNDKCQDDADKPRKPKKPPAPPPEVPPDEPIDVDPPYNDDPENPDNDTDPYEGDGEIPPPPPPKSCYQWVGKNGFGQTVYFFGCAVNPNWKPNPAYGGVYYYPTDGDTPFVGREDYGATPVEIIPLPTYAEYAVAFAASAGMSEGNCDACLVSI